MGTETRERTFTQPEVNDIVEKRLKRERQTRSDTLVVHEPRVYGLESPHSFYADMWLMQQPAAQEHRGALERRGQYAQELAHEMEQRSPEGRRAEREIRARLRTLNAGEHEKRASEAIREARAFVTSGGITVSAAGGGAAAFVSPFFLLDAWAPFRGIQRSFADQCYKLPLPPYGMQIYLPTMTSTAKVSKQTEGGAVTETVPATALEGAEVKTATGQITITQQIFDRAFTGGGSMDAVIHGQLHEQLDQEVDLYAINQALATAETVAGQNTYKTANLYQDIALGREKLTDTAGTRLRPTHFFTTSDFYSYATRQVDGSERPIITPKAMPGFPLTKGADDWDSGPAPQWARFTGTVMPGSLLWFENDNIPVSGTGSRTQLIVSAPETAIVLMEDAPVLTAYVETSANELKVVVNLREYLAGITRHPAGTAVITGGAYTTSLV
jgi:hypothetical protein